MILLAIICTLVLPALLVVVTFVQVLNLEALRFRARELPALEYFKAEIEPRLKLNTEQCVLALSIVKHTLVLLLGVAVLLMRIGTGGASWRALVESMVISWGLLLLGAYILPQVLYRGSEGRWLPPLMPLVRAMLLAVSPLTYLLGFFQTLATLNEEPEGNGQASSATEDIEALITAGAEEGLIEESDRELIESAVAFGDKTVREVMTPRPNIVGIDERATLEDLRKVATDERYSRIPTFREAIDNITGFVHVRDMFEVSEAERPLRPVRSILREVRFVPETKPIPELLREMQEDRAHMAVVVDEYGNTAGLVTLEDLVEEVFGEIRDEHEPEIDVTEDDTGGFIISGNFDVDRLASLVDYHGASDRESTTVGGLVTEWMGRVPRPGEAVCRDGLRIQVLASNGLRVDQVRVSAAPAAASE
jgi:putative hemolysin